MKRIEKYIKQNSLEGKKIADVLRDYDRGITTLGEICYFYGYSIDAAMGHIKKMEEHANS